ncbi:hypothetical protein N7507_002049 [Penicillium longicatenatum]|nr:hypothetical protein N7507_002049 [Penicillium longicatenatum]
MSVNKNLAGKVALVTGGSRGIGAAIAIKLAEHGANLAINYVSSATAAEAVAEQVRSHGVTALTVKADVSQEDEVSAMFQTIMEKFGRLDIAVSNSGIEYFAEHSETTGADIDRVFGVNVKGQYFVAQQAYKYMADHGRVMLTSSISAVKGVPRHAVYAASKAAVQGMTKCLAVDFGPRNITVNCIAAGGVKTDMYDENSAEYIPGGDKMMPEEIEVMLSKWSPLGRVGLPDDISNIAAFIASPESQWLTGQTFQATGGAYMV